MGAGRGHEAKGFGGDIDIGAYCVDDDRVAGPIRFWLRCLEEAILAVLPHDEEGVGVDPEEGGRTGEKVGR